MLTRVADTVLVHRSEFCQSNAVVVIGPSGVLLVDAGVTRDELTCLAADIRETGQRVVAAFSTHPHWDHLLWHPSLGEATRYATSRCAAAVHAWLSDPGWPDSLAWLVPPDLIDRVPREGLGRVTGLPQGATAMPWDGPRVRLVEHQGHARGHAALLIEGDGVLVAGDMLSDVLVPMLDLNAADPIDDYLDAVQLLAATVGEAAVRLVVPGHGSIATGDQIRARIDRDRAYVVALRDGVIVDDPRVGPSATYDWVADVHQRQRQLLAERSRDAGSSAQR